jgi:U4/U6 small nuclear ribonucleoprotein PRP3
MADNAGVGSGSVASDIEAKKAEAARKIQEMKARMAAQRGEKQAQSSTPPPQATSQPPQLSDREARIAEARARAAELSKQRNTVPASTGGTTPVAPPPRQDGRTAKGGLGVGLHPSLMGDLSAPSSSSAGAKGKGLPGPKFSTTKGNQQPNKAILNPYLSALEDDGTSTPASRNEDSATYDPNVISKKATRKSKALQFNPKGKFITQANALRQQARLEEMKRRIAAETRKVEIEEASDRAFLVPVPPEVEWWDEGLLPEDQNSYENCLEDGRNKIDAEDGIITILIQRPALLAPPQEKFMPEPKPLMLTQKEQKKLRRQRRMADMKEEQAKIRLGLVEPPPPKVKKSNMMRVLGEQAVKDPTAVEARVNREIAQRAADHEKANEDRALTKEQRAEKLKNQQAGDEAKGVKISVFRVDNLSSGKHRYQVDVNAKQNALTGIVVLHPNMNLVIVEGGKHSINSYQKLMLNRIKWSENTLPLGNSGNSTTFTSGASRDDGKGDDGNQGNRGAYWINPMDDGGNLKDLSENRCVLVWEGDEASRVFKRWSSKAVETDGEAKDVLSRSKMENMWTLARSK